MATGTSVLALKPGASGRWLVETESGSAHVFDFDRASYVRRPSRGGRKLAYDRKTVEIAEIEHWPSVNSVFSLWVADPDSQDYEHYVQSAYVTRISPLAAGEDGRPGRPLSWNEAIGQVPPFNAWLLIGSEASFPTSRELARQRSGRSSDLYLWTSPKQAQRGDLVLIYFIAPRKAVHFAARALYPPVFDPSIEVEASNTVDPNQWWTRLTPMVEVPALTYRTLQELHDGHLILRGKPTHYISPRVFDGIMSRWEGRLSVEHMHVLQRPTGAPELPRDPDAITLEQWRAIADGALALEARVEQYVVEPMLRLALKGDPQVRWQRQLRIPGAGIADYGVFVRDRLACVVEVKTGIRLLPGADLRESPDFRQVIRYAVAADVPALLLDSSKILLIDRGANEPRARFDRRTCTTDDLTAIREHVCGTRERSRRTQLTSSG